MRGGGGDGKDKEKDDRPRRADEAVLVWEKGMVRGEGGGTAFCEPRTRRGVRTFSTRGGYCRRRHPVPLAQAGSGEEKVGWGWRGPVLTRRVTPKPTGERPAKGVTLIALTLYTRRFTVEQRNSVHCVSAPRRRWRLPFEARLEMQLCVPRTSSAKRGFIY